MRKSILSVTFIAMALAAILFSKQHQPVAAQQRAGLTPEQIAQRNQPEQELESVAIVERKLMIPMRDGKKMAAEAQKAQEEN